jgi:hypothetical protein
MIGYAVFITCNAYRDMIQTTAMDSNISIIIYAMVTTERICALKFVGGVIYPALRMHG